MTPENPHWDDHGIQHGEFLKYIYRPRYTVKVSICSIVHCVPALEIPASPTAVSVDDERMSVQNGLSKLKPTVIIIPVGKLRQLL